MRLSLFDRAPRPVRVTIAAFLAAPGFVLAFGGCSSMQHPAVDFALSSAHRPGQQGHPAGTGHARPSGPPNAVPTLAPSRYQLLAGDLHTHVSPPDHPSHVVRDLAETQRLATSEKLDFVVLTPHVWARFYLDEGLREMVKGQQANLRKAIAALPPSPTMWIPGIEYTDGQYGHVGVAFSNLDEILDQLPIDEARAHPERFFERHVAAGGLLVVNHPFTTPVNFVVQIAREDLSWRPWLSEGPFPAEIQAVDRLAQGYEAYNLTTTDLRDRFLLMDREHSVRRTLAKLDTEIPRQHRRMSPVGGSDSHSHHLRATTFVLAETRSPAGVRDAIVAGRTCIRDPGACSFRARPAGGEWVEIGGSIDHVEAVEITADGSDIEVRRNGESVVRPPEGKTGWVTVPKDSCSVLRARVGRGESAGIFVNCGLGQPTASK